jgi:hypothetical protein
MNKNLCPNSHPKFLNPWNFTMESIPQCSFPFRSIK